MYIQRGIGRKKRSREKREKRNSLKRKLTGGFFTIKTEFITCLFFIANNLYGQNFLLFCVHCHTNAQHMRWFAERGRIIFLLCVFFSLFSKYKYIFTHFNVFFLSPPKIKAKKQQNHLLMAHAKRFVVEHYDLVINVYWAIIIKATKRRGREKEREECNTHAQAHHRETHKTRTHCGERHIKSKCKRDDDMRNEGKKQRKWLAYARRQMKEEEEITYVKLAV